MHKLESLITNKYILWSAMPLSWLAAISYIHTSGPSGTFETLLPRRAAMVSPLPFVWLLVLRLVDSQTPIKPRISIWPAVALVAFTIAMPRRKHIPYQDEWMWVGMIAACIAFVPLLPVWNWIKRNAVPASVALLAALTAKLYFWLNGKMWFYMCKWNGQIIEWFLAFFRDDVVLRIRPFKRIIELNAVETHGNWKDVYYTLRVHEPCSGLEGAFLFLFLLSATILFDYGLFRSRRLLPMYLVGVLYMLVFNSLRILFLFLVAAWSWKNDASALARSLRGWPLEMFHSYTGLALYLIAFGIFANWLYRSGPSGAER